MLPFDPGTLSEERLADLIAYHDRKYWEDNTPEISDEDYDALTRALTALNPEHPLLRKVSAVTVASEGKVAHTNPMLSLDKAYSLQEVMDWAGKFARSKDEIILVQPKYDGISALWEDAVLSTRGDGYTGEDISDKVPLIELESVSGTMPLTQCNTAIRGEIVIREDDFRTLYSKIRNRNGQLYKNSRKPVVARVLGF